MSIAHCMFFKSQCSLPRLKNLCAMTSHDTSSTWRKTRALRHTRGNVRVPTIRRLRKLVLYQDDFLYSSSKATTDISSVRIGSLQDSRLQSTTVRCSREGSLLKHRPTGNDTHFAALWLPEASWQTTNNFSAISWPAHIVNCRRHLGTPQ